MSDPCCTGLSRSRLLHRALAEAGRGLPAIEPGTSMADFRAGAGVAGAAGGDGARIAAGGAACACPPHKASRLAFTFIQPG